MSLDAVDERCAFSRIAEREPGYTVALMGGEPTLHPDLPQIVDLVKSHNPTVKILVLTKGGRHAER
jgi:MoaA/NifB/PqqE/SkfB family radical SAM enzyme